MECSFDLVDELQGILAAADATRASLILLDAGEFSIGETPSHTFPLAREIDMKHPLVGHRVEDAEGDDPRIIWLLRGPFFVSTAAELARAACRWKTDLRRAQPPRRPAATASAPCNTQHGAHCEPSCDAGRHIAEP